MTHLYAQWRRGLGPRDSIAAYISTSMRNALKDEWKSSRSTEMPLPAGWEKAASDEPSLADVESYRENRLLREALSRLPPDQRTVLVRSILLDEKPRHLCRVVARTAPAVSSLLRRSRISLRRALVTVFLLDTAISPGCTTFATSDIASQYADSLLTSPPSTGHPATCAACSAALVAVRDFAQGRVTEG